MVLQREQPLRVWGWALEGEPVRVEIAGQQHDTITREGTWEVILSPLPAGGPHTMTVQGVNTIVLEDVLVGDVWLASGQSNMQWSVNQTHHTEETLAIAEQPTIRLLRVERRHHDEPQEDVIATWTEANAETVQHFSAVAFHFGLELAGTQDIPIGLIQAAAGGTRIFCWMSDEALASDPKIGPHQEDYEELLANLPEDLRQWRAGGKQGRRPINPDRRHPTGLFNQMVHGLAPFGLTGFIWYQGESDARTDQIAEYAPRHRALIRDWRSLWGNANLPFFLVQLTGYGTDGRLDNTWPHLREAQAEVEETVSDTHMAVIIEQGVADDIHPGDKRPVAHRLARLARHEVYGETALVARGPKMSDVMFADGQATVSWEHLGDGLRVEGDTLRGFEIAGEDGIFHSVEAQVAGAQVLARSADVPVPTALRYSFRGFPDGNLFNSEGLPAAPFRTDR